MSESETDENADVEVLDPPTKKQKTEEDMSEILEVLENSIQIHANMTTEHVEKIRALYSREMLEVKAELAKYKNMRFKQEPNNDYTKLKRDHDHLLKRFNTLETDYKKMEDYNTKHHPIYQRLKAEQKAQMKVCINILI